MKMYKNFITLPFRLKIYLDTYWEYQIVVEIANTYRNNIGPILIITPLQMLMENRTVSTFKIALTKIFSAIFHN